MLTAGTRIGPFEVLSPVGAGGMGEVYRARDTRLDRDVAIKVLPAEFAADPDRLRRFEQEARAVAALSHPNILALYDVGTHEGAPYIITELLEGESLRELLRSGSLPVGTAVEIGVQIAHGLAAAHEKGIVHRDLKPGNVFVSKGGHVKILDFGIAKLAAPKSAAEAAQATTVADATQAGTTLGTVGYLSPEQARGMVVDPRSDIFSVGVVLYEMLSGQRPFLGETATDTLAAILMAEPAPLPEGVAPALRGVVAQCLAKRPDQRFSSAHDLALALSAGAREDAGPTKTGGKARPLRLRVPITPIVGVAVVLLVAMVGGLWLRGRGKPGPAVALETSRVLVAPFENLTGVPSFDALVGMASEAVSQGLGQIGQIELVTAGPKAPRRAASLAIQEWCAAARSRGAGTLVRGSCYLAGDTLELRTWLIDAGSEDVVYALDPDSGPRGEPRLVIEAARERVKGAVAGHVSPLRGFLARPLRYEAFREFEEGMASYGFDWEAGSRHFRRVVELEPDCWMAQIRLAEYLGSEGKSAEAAAVWAKVRANQARLSPIELLYVKLDDARRAGNPVEALRAARHIRELAPHDLVTGWNVAFLASLVNRPREALAALGDVRAMDWTRVGRLQQGEWFLRVAAWSHHLLGEYGAELEVAELALRVYPGSAASREHQVRALAALGRLKELDQAIEASLSAVAGEGSPATVMLEAAEELRAHGHAADAVGVAVRGAEWYASRSSELAKARVNPGIRVELLWMAQRWEEARRAAVAWSAENAKNIAARGVVGVLAERLGDRATADAVDATLAAPDGPRRRPYALYLRSAMAAQRGAKDRSLDLLREAFAKGLPFDLSLHRYVYFEPLHGYPPFEELIKPQG